LTLHLLAHTAGKDFPSLLNCVCEASEDSLSQTQLGAARHSRRSQSDISLQTVSRDNFC